MPIILSKLAAYLVSPMGIFTALVVFAILFRLFGRKLLPSIIFAIALALLFLSATPKLAGYLSSQLEDRYPPVAVNDLTEAEVAVVLGGLLAPPVSPRIQIELTDSSDRLLQGLRIFRAGKVKRLYLSGGNVFDGYLDYPESDYARTLLNYLGVPRSRIEIGGDSKTTHQNAIETHRFLSRTGLINKPVILVTSALHMPRAVETFRAQGIRVIPAATDLVVTDATTPGVFQWLPSAKALEITSRTWHEIVGLWYYRMRGWAIPSNLE